MNKILTDKKGAATSVAHDGTHNHTTKVVSPKTSTTDTKGAATSVAQSETHNHTTKVISPRRGNLPHISLLGHYQFVTFRTRDSVDEFLSKIREENISNSLKEYKIDAYLDSSKKGSYLNDEVLAFLYDYLKQQDKNLYELAAFCVMPNHIHILFKQCKELKGIMKIIKGATSFEINKILNHKESFWEKGYFDRAIRDEKHFATTYEYIQNNPIKADLKDAERRFYGIYE